MFSTNSLTVPKNYTSHNPALAVQLGVQSSNVTVKIGFSLVTACVLTGKNNKNSSCKGRVSRLPPQRKPTEEPRNGPQLVGARSYSFVGGFTDDG